MHGSDAARASRDANVPEIERPRPDRPSPHHDHGEIFSASLTATIYTMIAAIIRGNVSARHCLAAQHQPCANRRQRCTARGAVFHHSPSGLEAPPTQCHEPGVDSTASRPWLQLIASRPRCSTWCRDGTAGGHRHRRPAVPVAHRCAASCSVSAGPIRHLDQRTRSRRRAHPGQTPQPPHRGVGPVTGCTAARRGVRPVQQDAGGMPETEPQWGSVAGARERQRPQHRNLPAMPGTAVWSASGRPPGGRVRRTGCIRFPYALSPLHSTEHSSTAGASA